MAASGLGTGYRYLQLLYDKLVELSKFEPASALVEFGYPQNDPEDVLVFRGYIYSMVSAKVGLSKSSHGSAMASLYAMRCLTQLKTGSLRTESVYILHYKPTEEQYVAQRRESSATSRRISPTRYDTLIDELTRVKTKLKELELRLKDMEEANARYNVRGS